LKANAAFSAPHSGLHRHHLPLHSLPSGLGALLELHGFSQARLALHKLHGQRLDGLLLGLNDLQPRQRKVRGYRHSSGDPEHTLRLRQETFQRQRRTRTLKAGRACHS